VNEFEKVLAKIPHFDAERFEREEAQRRAAESREVLTRLPEFLRSGTPRQLLGRVGSGLIRRAVEGWSWTPNPTSGRRSGTLLIMGPSRAGKSAAAAWLYRRLVAEGVTKGGDGWLLAHRLNWAAASDLESADREHGLGKGPFPGFTDAAYASLLFLDDAGWDKDPRVVSEVLACRYERALPTIITTGRNREQLEAHYGPAVVRRMLESGGPGVAKIVDAFTAKGAA
jgi:hypothetical protein